MAEAEKDREKDKERQKKNKIGYMVLSIIISIIIWVMVAYMTDPDVTKTLHNVDVRFVGEDMLIDKGLIVTDENELPDLSVKISGKRSDMIYAIDNVVIEVDVSDIDSEGEYDLEGTVILPNSRINLERVRFDTVPVVVGEYAEKNIDIEIRQTGTLKGKLVKSESEMKSVKITGSKDEIDSVASGYAVVDISKLEDSQSLRTNFVLVDNAGNLISKNETISTETPDIIINNTVYNAVELPVKAELSDELQGRYTLDEENTEIEPERVTVGVLPGESYSEVKTIVKDTDSEEHDCDLQEEEGMYIPDNVKKVKFKASVIGNETFTSSLPVEVVNIQDGLHVEGAPGITAQFKGIKEYSNEIQAYADASGLSEGTYTLPVTFTGKGMKAEGTYSVEIVLKR